MRSCFTHLSPEANHRLQRFHSLSYGPYYERSFDLMCDLLPDDALRELFETGWINISTKYNRYMISESGGVRGWCVHPSYASGGVPLFDTIAIMYLMITHHEVKFRIVANKMP